MEILIGKIVNDEKLAGNQKKRAGVATAINALATSCAILKDKWVRQLFSTLKEPLATRYVQYHQAGITALSNQVSTRIPTVPKQGDQTQLYGFYAEAADRLKDLLQFLKTGFYKYFDHDHHVSLQRCRQQAEKIELLLLELLPALLRAGIDPELMSAIGISVNSQLADARQTGISYRQLESCKGTLRIIGQLLKEQPATGSIQFARELYRQNFNSYQFSLWYRTHLDALIATVPETERTIAILHEIMLLEQIFVSRSKTFEPDLPPINVQLISWLQELLAAQPANNLAANKQQIESIRLPLRLSVAQLALFVRLCHLEGCLQLNNISAIIRFFTLHFETKRQVNISYKSFAHAFYGSDQGSAAVVRDCLKRMTDTINKTYFP